LLIQPIRGLEIPKEGLWSYVNRGPAFFFIELQRKTKGKYVHVEGRASMDNVPVDDVDTLYQNETKNFQTWSGILFHYTKGQYRICVLATFSSLNKLPDVYSDWFYFKCENDIHFPRRVTHFITLPTTFPAIAPIAARQIEREEM
jgi:hypothetical protein